MSSISPTLEGFRAAFRRPSVTFGEIIWRWNVGATVVVLFFFGFAEYLNTLPVSNLELFFLRTRQPYFVWQALWHILHGSMSRAVMSLMIAGLLLTLVWMIAASLGRMVIVRYVLTYFRRDAATAAGRDEAGGSATGLSTVMRLNFLRAAVVLACVVAFVGAAIVARAVSPDTNPTPGLAFFVFLPLAALIGLIGWGLNWFLSLSAIFAVRNGEDAAGSMLAALAFCRERAGTVFAVSSWTGLAHLVAFSVFSTAAFVPLGFAGLLPARLILAAILLVTLVYFAVADWLYIARLAGYVCIMEMPEAVEAPLPPVAPAPLATTIDRDEPILSDVPGLLFSPET